MSLISNDNILDNAYFVGGGSQQGGGQFPINQRGKTVYSTAEQFNWVYCADRWMNDGQVSLVEGGLQLAATGSYNAQMFQKFEQSRVVKGEVYTASMLLANGELVTESGVITFDVREHEWMFGGDRLYVARDIGTLGAVGTVVGQGQDEIIVAMQLEPGPVQTLAHKDASGNWVLNAPPPHFALELAKCQRYQLVLGKSVYAPIGMFVQSIQDQLACYIPTSISLRAKPAVNIHGIFRVIGPNENKLVSFISSDGGNMVDNGIIIGFVPSVEISSDVGWIDAADAQSYVLLDCNL